MFIPAQSEAAIKAAQKLMARGVQTAVGTLGGRGAFIATPDGNEMVSGFKVVAIDTAATGDTFNGALAVALAEGRTLKEAVRFANAAGGFSVTRFGAQPSVPAQREIEDLLARGHTFRRLDFQQC